MTSCQLNEVFEVEAEGKDAQSPLIPNPRQSHNIGKKEQQRIFSPEPPGSQNNDLNSCNHLLHDKLSPLVKIRHNSDEPDIPKRVLSMQIEKRLGALKNELLNEGDVGVKQRLSIPNILTENTTNQQTSFHNQHESASRTENLPTRQRNSNQVMDESLAHLLDDISEISVSGNQPYLLHTPRGEHDSGTPFIRSPTANREQLALDPNVPFGQAQHADSPRQQHQRQDEFSKIGSKGHQGVVNSQHSNRNSGPTFRIAIPRGVLNNAKPASIPTHDVRGSQHRKIHVQDMSLDSSMISERQVMSGESLGTQFAAQHAKFKLQQAQGELNPSQISTTGGQHEQMEQYRQRVLSFSEYSEADTSQLSYQKARSNATQQNMLTSMTFPQSNHSTNSGSDIDNSRIKRRHRQGVQHHHSHIRRGRKQDESVDLSDSRLSVRFSTPKARQSKKSRFPMQEVQQQQLNPMETAVGTGHDYVHPYAHQPTPYEKLQEICTNFSETAIFFSFEVLSWIIGNLWNMLISVVLFPVALIGLAIDYLRQWARHCPRRRHGNNIIRTQMIRAPNKRRRLQIVLDLDNTLVFCSRQSPEEFFGGVQTPEGIEVATVQKQGDEDNKIFIYKRPNLREFLQKVSQLGHISIFTHHQASYVDPILDKLDPENRYFKNRFYNDHCWRNGDGEIIKDMRFLEPLIESSQPAQALDGQVHYSFSQRLNQAIGFPVFGQSAFSSTASSVGNQGDIQLSRNLLQRLVIVDDGIITYNAYKNNTIRIMQWKANMRNDRALSDCLEIIQQLGNHRESNVSKDLQYIIDTTSMYQPNQTSTVLQ